MDLIAGSYSYDGDDYIPLMYYKNVGTSSAPVYEKQSGSNDPFANLDLGYMAFPSLVDIDNDGDLDLFSASYGLYQVTFYKNTGTATNPQFEQQTGVDNPLADASFEEFAALGFADIDGDGDLDCFMGTYEESDSYYGGTLKFYRNIGSAESPEFGEATNPVDFDFSNGYIIVPELADFDDDGDFDLLVGMYWESEDVEGAVMKYFKNDGTATEPDFVDQIGVDNPFESLIPTDAYFVMPALADLDNDGDIDLAAGVYGGKIFYYRNTSINSVEQNTNAVGLKNLYPNPVDDFVTFEFTDANHQAKLSIYDITGKLIETAVSNETRASMDMSNLPAGVYFVKVAMENDSVETYKVIKK